MARQTRRLAATATTITALALLAAGCLSSGSDNGDDSKGESDGNVTILGNFGGAEREAFEASLTEFESSSGISVAYTDDQDFATTVKAKVNSGDAPDIALFPQPGGLLELSDKMTPLDEIVDVDGLESTLIPGFLEAATKDGTVYGAPMRMAVKSIVWYPKDAYEATGLSTSPKTIQELASVANQLKADTKAPWCMGWESDQATGWVGTDWLEEMVLRTAGPDVYDKWVAHEIPFNDPQIVTALDEFGKIAKTKGQVFGDVKGILNTGFADAMNPAFKAKPDCMLMRQGNFATGFFPDAVQDDLDGSVGTFVYPPFEGGYDGQPILGGGDLAAAFNGSDDDVKKVMEFLTSDEFGGAWAEAGGWLSPHTTFDESLYADETTRDIAQIAVNADIFKFDGSDLMPKAVGSGSFWTGMVDWVGGKSSKDTLDAIEASWPTS